MFASIRVNKVVVVVVVVVVVDDDGTRWVSMWLDGLRRNGDWPEIR